MAPPQQGDEAALYQSFNDELVRTVRGSITTTTANVEDACAFAWMQFLRYQPDRDRNWRGWLFRTAAREAVRLHSAERGTRYFGLVEPDNPDRRVAEPADPRHPQTEHLEVGEALALLSRVPERRREVAVLRLAGFRYREIADILGLSRTRVEHLLREADAALNRERTQRRADPHSPPRLARLNELEQHPPPWLEELIGRPPGDRQATGMLAWRRAALAIDNYRERRGMGEVEAGLGERPQDPAAASRYDRTRWLIDRLQDARHIGCDLGRER